MDLLKVSISKDALVEREELYKRIATNPEAVQQGISDHFPPVRNHTDAIRAALTYHCRQWKRAETSGAECRMVRKASNGAKGLNLRIRVERLPDDAEQEIASVIAGANGKPVVITMTPEGKQHFPELHFWLADVD